jgi:hypothetical protein
MRAQKKVEKTEMTTKKMGVQRRGKRREQRGKRREQGPRKGGVVGATGDAPRRGRVAKKTRRGQAIDAWIILRILCKWTLLLSSII